MANSGRRAWRGASAGPPRSVWAAQTGVPPLDGVAAALADFDRIADRSPLEIEVQVSSFLGELGAGTPAPADPDEPDVDEPDVDELVNGVVEVCMHHLDQSPPRVVLDFLWVLDAFDPPYVRWPLRERLQESALPSRPAWAMDVGQARLVAAHRVEHETGDGYDVALVARHRSADRDHVVAAYVDRTLGGLATDLLVHGDAAEYLQLSRDADGMRVDELDVAVAAATIDQAIGRTFDAGVPAAVADEFAPFVSVVDHYADKVDRRAAPLPEPRPLSIAEVEAVVDRFLGSLEGMGHRADREVLVDAVSFVASELGGDPLRWSPAVSRIVVSGWRPMSGHDLGDRLAGTLRSFLPWAHRQRGWSDRHLPDALAALQPPDDVDPPPGPMEMLEQAIDEGVDLDDEAALDAFLDRYLEEA